MTQDPDDKEYHTAKIEITELFKGEMRTTISVYTGSRLAGGADCGIWTEPGSEWLIVADQHNNRLSFGLCSSSKQLLPANSPVTRFDDKDLKVLRLMRDKLGSTATLDQKNNYFWIRDQALDEFKGTILTGESVALYLATFDIKGNLKNLKAIHEFKNRSVAARLNAVLEKQLYIKPFNSRIEKDPSNRQRLIAIYYIPGSKGMSSMMSTHNF